MRPLEPCRMLQSGRFHDIYADSFFIAIKRKHSIFTPMTTSNPLHVGSGISRTVEPAARFQIGGFYPTFGMEFPLLAPLSCLGFLDTCNRSGSLCNHWLLQILSIVRRSSASFLSALQGSSVFRRDGKRCASQYGVVMRQCKLVRRFVARHKDM
jgi:hypothetical protein